MLQRGAAGSQLLDVWVTDGAVGGEEKLSKPWQAAGKLLETTSAALQRGAPTQVQLLQQPEQTQENQFRPGVSVCAACWWWSIAATLNHYKYKYSIIHLKKCFCRKYCPLMFVLSESDKCSCVSTNTRWPLTTFPNCSDLLPGLNWYLPTCSQRRAQSGLDLSGFCSATGPESRGSGSEQPAYWLQHHNPQSARETFDSDYSHRCGPCLNWSSLEPIPLNKKIYTLNLLIYHFWFVNYHYKEDSIFQQRLFNYYFSCYTFQEGHVKL